VKNLRLPYGKNNLNFEIDDKHLLGIFQPALPPAAANALGEVERALREPIGSEPLEVLARGKQSAVVIASDHTRPVPSRILMPAILRQLRLGSPDIDVTILIATGCHRATSRAELIGKFGEDIVRNERIVIHDCDNENMLVELGVLPSGGTLKLNKLAVQTDLLVAEGFIEPHFFAGFSGGRKSVLPGIAARETVMANHCAEFIDSGFARTGNLENNPIHQDMLFAAKQAKLAFILNVVIDEQKNIIRAFAGDAEAAHADGCAFLKQYCKLSVPQVDVVITSNGGYPLDQNIYQSVKGMTSGEAVCRKNGVIIIAASCADGHGGEAFYKVLSKMCDAEELLQQIKAVPRHKTPPDQWQYQILARILQNHKVIIVTSDCSHDLIRSMHMYAADSVEVALSMAEQWVGKDYSAAVITDGVSGIVVKAV